MAATTGQQLGTSGDRLEAAEQRLARLDHWLKLAEYALIGWLAALVIGAVVVIVLVAG